MTTRCVEVVADASPTVDATIVRLGQADVVVAMRLHAAVMATTLGVPTVALSYAPKVASYMAQVGMGEFVTGSHSVRAPWIAERVASALDRSDLLRDRLVTATDALAARYDANRRWLRTLVR